MDWWDDVMEDSIWNKPPNGNIIRDDAMHAMAERNASAAAATPSPAISHLKQGAYGKVPIHKHSKLEQLLHLDEVCMGLGHLMGVSRVSAQSFALTQALAFSHPPPPCPSSLRTPHSLHQRHNRSCGVSACSAVSAAALLLSFCRCGCHHSHHERCTITLTICSPLAVASPFACRNWEFLFGAARAGHGGGRYGGVWRRRDSKGEGVGELSQAFDAAGLVPAGLWPRR